jgi:hypothetical protein
MVVKRKGERVPYKTGSWKLPTWQCDILVERYGSIGGGIRCVVEEVVTADVDLLDSSPTMLRLIADQLEIKRGKLGAVND